MKKSFLFLLTLLLTALPMLRADELTVNDGTVGNDYVPVYGLYTDSKQITQFIIPAESLEDLGAGAIISKLTFYVKTSASVAWTSTFNVSLLEVPGTTIGSSYENLSSATLVYSGTLDATASTMDVVFTTPYVYNGGNLLVDTRNLAAGNYKSATFYGVSAPGASAESHSGSTTPTARNFLPKVTIEYTAGAPADCPNMGAPWVEEYDATSATIFWEEVEDVEFYQYVVVAKGEEPVWDEAEPIDMTLAELSDLEPSTEYDFYVRTWCDEELYGRVKKLSFKTACGAISALPYTMGFESAENLDCWILPTGVAPAASYQLSGSQSLKFNTQSDAVVILPAFEESLSGLELTYNWRCEGTSYTGMGYLEAGYVTDLEDATTFVQINNHHYRSYAYEMVKMYFSSDVPDGARAAFRYTGQTGNDYLFVDDVKVDVVPACLMPSNIHFVSAAATTATFAWEGTSAQYNVIVKNGNDTIANVIVDNAEFTLENLNHSSNYTLTLLVKGVCGTDESEEAAKTIAFATECVLISELPWVIDFENVQSGSGKIPACFAVNSSSTTYPYVYNSSAYAGKQCLYFYGKYAKQAFITPQFDASVDLSACRISFMYKNYSTSTSYGQFVVGSMTDPEDFTTFHPLDTLVRKGSYTAYELYLTNIPATDHYLAINLLNNGSSSSDYGHYIDNLSVSLIPTCFPGTKLHAIDSLATLNSVSFGWTPNVADNLNAHVVVKNGETVIADALVNDSVYTVTGLQHSQRYTFNIQVNTVCDGVDSPDALTGTLNFATECAAQALPWSYSFADAASTVLPVCWEKVVASGSYPSVSTSSKALNFYGGGSTSDQIVALPEMDGALNPYTLTLKYSTSVNTSTIYGTLKVGYYTDLAGEFVEVTELPQAGSATEEEVFLSAVPAEAKYLAIRYNGGTSNYGSAYVYELSLTETPSCVPVKSVAFSNVERRTLDIAWTPKVPAAAYDLVISDAVLSEEALAAAQVIAVADSATTYHATGLMRDTKYYVYVRANCGAEDGQSAWVVDSVKTMNLGPDCSESTPGEIALTGSGSEYAPVSAFYKNSYVEQLYTAAELQEAGLSAGYVSKVAFKYILSSSYAKTVSLYVGTTSDVAVSATNGFYTPAQAMAAKSVTFNTANKWYEFELETPVYWDGESSLVVGVLAMGSSYWSSGVAGFAGGATTNNTILYRRSDSDNPLTGMTTAPTASTARPNIQLTVCPPGSACPTVGAISHELLGDGTSSARIAWTASTGDFANSYSLVYSDTLITDWTAVVPQIDSIQALDTVISDLNAYTDYYVYVAAHCDGEGQHDGSSEWSEAYTFKTAANCPVIVDLAFNKTGRNTALATWKADYADKNFMYVLSTEEMDEAALAAAATVSVTDTFVVFESLDYEQTYYLYVAHDCGEGAHSPYLSASIQTSASCPAVVNLHATETKAYTVLVAWESAEFAEETAWEVGVVGRESVAQTVAAKQALVIGLEAETDYTIYVKAICSEEESSALATLDVHTAVAPTADATVGNGTATSTLVNYSWGNTYSQQIYTAAELNALGYSAGKINSVAFNYTGTSSSYQKAQSIYIGTTSKDEFAGYTTADFVNLDLVYGPEVRSYASGWQTYEFSAPFEWDGTSNIVVGVLTNQPGTNQSSASGWTAAGTSLTSVYRAIEKHRDNAAIDITDMDDLYGARLAIRPNIKFGFDPQACPAAKGLAASEITTTSATLSWVPGAAEISWEVVLSDKALTNDELDAAEKDVLTYQLSKQYAGLTPDVDYHFYVRSLCSEENGDWAHATFMTLPSCNIPTDIHVESTGLDNAVIAWSSEAAQFEVTYSNGEIENTVLVSDTNCVISGLNHSTIYTFTASVRAICGAADSSRWSAPATLKFATECAPVAALPWSESFEDFETGFAAGAPLCWNTINCNTGSSTTYPVVFVNTNSGYVHSGTQSLFFQSGANAHAIAILPEFADDLSGAEIAFWYRNEGVSASNGTLSVGYITDITDQNSFVALQTLEKTTTLTEVVQLLATVPAGARVAFDYVGGTSDNYYLGIDDVVIRPATTCFRVSDIHVVSDSTTAHSATIAWSAPEEGGDQFKVLVKNGEDILVNNELVSDTFLVVSGLNASTIYTLSVSVNTYCGEGDESEVVTKTVSFATDCEAISSFPWSEDFEAYTSGQNANTFLCYSVEKVLGSPANIAITTTSSEVHGGSKALKFTYTALHSTVALNLPDMLFEEGKTYELSFWLKGHNSGSADDMSVRYDDVTLATLNGAAVGGTYTEYKYTIVGTGEVKNITFQFNTTDGYWMYLDDITISEVHIPVITKDSAFSLVVNEEEYELPYTSAEMISGDDISALVLKEVITYSDGVESKRDTTYLGLADEVVLDREHNTVALEGNNDIVVTADAAGTYTFSYDEEYNLLIVTFPSKPDPDPTTGIDDVAAENKTEKIVRNGKVYILRDGKIYSVMGHVVKSMD